MKYIYITLLIVSTAIHSVHATQYSSGWELWYPYQYHNKNGELVGVDIQAFDAIMKQADIKYSIAEIPWKTHLHFVKTGKVDMAMGASWSNERCKYAYFSLPYRTETVKLFVKKGRADEIKLTTFNELGNSPYIIGVESGYYYGDAYAELIKQSSFYANISEAIDIETNVSLVIAGHLDGFLADPYTVDAFIEKYKMQGEFEAHDVEIYSADIYIMLSKASTDTNLLERVNMAIKTLQAGGQLEKTELKSSRDSIADKCQE